MLLTLLHFSVDKYVFVALSPMKPFQKIELFQSFHSPYGTAPIKNPNKIRIRRFDQKSETDDGDTERQVNCCMQIEQDIKWQL